MKIHRTIQATLERDLHRKMVFLGGPRQVGKTYFATHLKPKNKFAYLNWDIETHRTKILDRELPESPLLILDEIHKYRRWRNFLKSVADSIQVGERKKMSILVTGSARLDYYRFGGDSLQGRYHYFRLLPLSLHEMGAYRQSDLLSLYEFSGFPEPFFLQSERETRRWTREYQARLVREELRDLEQVQDLGTCELLLGRLGQCVGSPLSLNALREDLQVAHQTIKKWILFFERIYAVFRLSPFGSAKVRAVKKEQKLYFFNWTVVADKAHRFENLFAAQLLKYCFFVQDTEGRDLELRYFRDTDGREIDFLLTESDKPLIAVECKLTEQPISKHLYYFHHKFPDVPCYQVHLMGEKDYRAPEGIRVCPARLFLERKLAGNLETLLEFS